MNEKFEQIIVMIKEKVARRFHSQLIVTAVMAIIAAVLYFLKLGQFSAAVIIIDFLYFFYAFINDKTHNKLNWLLENYKTEPLDATDYLDIVIKNYDLANNTNRYLRSAYKGVIDDYRKAYEVLTKEE